MANTRLASKTGPKTNSESTTRTNNHSLSRILPNYKSSRAKARTNETPAPIPYRRLEETYRGNMATSAYTAISRVDLAYVLRTADRIATWMAKEEWRLAPLRCDHRLVEDNSPVADTAARVATDAATTGPNLRHDTWARTVNLTTRYNRCTDTVVRNL